VENVLVIKFGGHAMTDGDGLFAQKVADAVAAGRKIVIVHGGGPQINAALNAAGIEPHFIGGYRVTTPEVFDLVEQVLSTEVGPSVARILGSAGINALAISGRHSGTLTANKQEKLVNGVSADLGLVGEICDVDLTAISVLLEKNVVPVISPIASDFANDGGLNVNADTAAAAIAGALGSEELIIMTDVAGIYRDWPNLDSLIESISFSELVEIKDTFSEGMAPKVQACLDAISSGAGKVRIIDGRDPSAFANALKQNGGTVVVT
jgi:acetylglutamate kinase